MVISILLRFFVVFLMSLLFGIERQLSNKPIGFGTFIFVACGSCALGVLSKIIAPTNTIVIIGGVVTGIGFLGAGALIRTTDKIFGFTTAASIWIFSIVGLTIGLEEYLVGTITYSIIWAVVLFDNFLEMSGIGTYQRKIIIHTKKIVEKDDVVDLFENHKWKLVSFEVDKTKKKSKISYFINVPRSYVNDLKERLEKKSWVEGFRIE